MFQGAKKDPKAGSKAPAKAPKKKEGGGGGKAKKKKWSKGKTRDKLNNLVLFDKPTYDKLLKEDPTYKLITRSIASERLKVRGSLAREAFGKKQVRNTSFINIYHEKQAIWPAWQLALKLQVGTKDRSGFHYTISKCQLS